MVTAIHRAVYSCHSRHCCHFRGRQICGLIAFTGSIRARNYPWQQSAKARVGVLVGGQIALEGESSKQPIAYTEALAEPNSVDSASYLWRITG